MQNLTLYVYKVVQDEFFTRKNPKVERKCFFLYKQLLSFVSFAKIKINLQKAMLFFLNHQNFQSKNYLAIFKKLLFLLYKFV